MIELTAHGMWFRWASLDQPSKLLAGASLAAAGLAAIPLGWLCGNIGWEFGQYLGSGGRTGFALPVWEAWLSWWTLTFGVASSLLWWRFSLRQDEMFNRIQNWSLAMAGGWSAALLSIWALLDLADALPPASPGAVIGLIYGLLLVFWFAAVRRWA